MKKYIIKNADGSEQNVMPAVHASRKEAGEILMDYICDYNEGLKVNDDDYLSPFDFRLEDADKKEDSVTLLNTEPVDWQHIRIQAAIAAMQGMMASRFTDIEDVSAWSVRAADALIEELKK